MSQLWPSSERGSSENVLNGIALGTDHILITGKRWDRMYKITFADWPTMFSGNEVKSVEAETNVEEGQASGDVEGGAEQAEPPSSPQTEASEESAEVDNDPLKALAKEVEGLPDYFVPLTPEEKAELKQRLHDTISKTGASLLSSANPTSGMDDVLPQRTFKVDPSISKQFMHMHHMKTGGTSMDGLIHCAISRQLQINNNTAIQYGSMSECGSGVRSCMDQLAKKLNATVVDNIFYYNDDQGKPIMDSPFDPAVGEFEDAVGDMNVCRTSDCGVMSYCASLHTVRTFGWKDVGTHTDFSIPELCLY